MIIHVFADAETVAREAAFFIAGIARQDILAKGRFVMAVSGGRTPCLMLRALGQQNIPWKDVYIVQVDERLAPEGHPERNLTLVQESLLGHNRVIPEQIYAMPVGRKDPETMAENYIQILQKLAGNPPVLDLIHLGLGKDGHTASLVPGDPVLKIPGSDVALTGLYQGRRRLTLTYPLINRARRILWVITGGEKSEMFKRFRDGDESIPAGCVSRSKTIVIVDKEAAGRV